mgnify:CR=1 FL=1
MLYFKQDIILINVEVSKEFIKILFSNLEIVLLEAFESSPTDRHSHVFQERHDALAYVNVRALSSDSFR